MRTLTVVGHGTSRAVPDTALVRLAAVHRAPSLAEALAGAGSAADAISTVGRAHVEAGRIASQDLYVWPAHDDQGRPSGFEARHALTIACPDLAVAGELIGALAIEVGDRLQIDGVSLVVADPSAAMRLARERAFVDARARAEHLARLAGAALGEVQSVSEGGGGSAPRGFDMVAASAKMEVSLEPGETTITDSLTVTWQLL